jgi:hypothetical protein
MVGIFILYMPAESDKSLAKKLGLKPNQVIRIFNEPEFYWDWLAPLSERIGVKTKGNDE